jgi:hypothetical protein
MLGWGYIPEFPTCNARHGAAYGFLVPRGEPWGSAKPALPQRTFCKEAVRRTRLFSLYVKARGWDSISTAHRVPQQRQDTTVALGPQGQRENGLLRATGANTAWRAAGIPSLAAHLPHEARSSRT